MREDKPSSMVNVLVTPTGGITPATFLILIGLPLLYSRQYVLGAFFILCGVVSALREATKTLKQGDKEEIRYNILSSEDIIAELEQLEKQEERDENSFTKCQASLAALARKYNRERGENLALICQQAAYICLRLFPTTDDIVAGAISLLALVAKSNITRRRNIYEADAYGLNHPIGALRKALQRAKSVEDEAKEELYAEIQRKGALYLGALADSDTELNMQMKIVEEDGLALILDAANWYRMHEGVANWALWASFIICYENVRNKIQFIRLAGVTTVCELVKSNRQCLEVHRHGVAILFDLLREGNETEGVKWDPWEVRKMALGAGLHEVLLNAMNEFSDSMDIMMMCQEMLLGTGYRGDIPRPQQP